MKTTNEQEQMLEQYKTEFQNVLFNKKLYTTTDSRNSLNEFMTEAYVEGRLKSIEEIEKLKREYTLITKSFCEKNDLKLQEKEQEIETLNKENSLLYRSHNKICEQLDHGEHLDIEWVKSIIQEEVTHPVITSSLRMMNIYKSKLPDQEELGRVLEICNKLDDDFFIKSLQRREEQFRIFRSFLESLKTTNREG